MKKMISFLLTITIITMCLIPSFAVSTNDESKWQKGYYYKYGDSYNGFAYYVYSNSSVRVKDEVSDENSFVVVYRYDSSDPSQITDEITIPSKIDGVTVKYIDYQERYYYDVGTYWRAQTIKIPEGVIGIGPKAFYNFEGSIILPKSLETISDEAFNALDHRGIINITIPSDGNLKYIGERAFTKTRITEITLPASCQFIGNQAFSNCQNLNKVTFLGETIEFDSGLNFTNCELLNTIDAPNLYNITGNFINAISDTPLYKNTQGALIIGKILIKYRDNGANEYTIPEGVVTIGERAFLGAKLSSITMPTTLKTIDKGAFYNCTSLQTVTLNEGLEKISDRSFDECISLTDITFPSTLKEIGEATFYYCKNLKSVDLPESLSIINENAFRDCINLQSVTFPKGISKIGDTAFVGCPLTECTILSPTVEIGSSALGYSFAGYEYNENPNFFESEYQSSYSKTGSFTLKGYSNSTVQQYANSYGFTFIPVEEEATIEESNIIVDNKNSLSNESIIQIISCVAFLLLIVFLIYVFIKKIIINKREVNDK